MKWIKEWGVYVNESWAREGDAIDAAKRGEKGRLEKLLDEGVSLETRDEFGRTLLQIAICYSKPETAEALLQRGAKPDSESHKGQPIIHDAVTSGKLSERFVSMLIEAGVDLEAREPEDGRTGLQVAALRGSPEIVEMMIKAGAEVNAPVGRKWNDDKSNTILEMMRKKTEFSRSRRDLEKGDFYRLNDRELGYLQDAYKIMQLLILAGAAMPKRLDSFDALKGFFDGDLSWYPGGEPALERKYRSKEIRKNLF